MLLNIYLATTVASVAIDFTKTLSTRKNLLKKGYVFSSEKKQMNLFSTIVNLVAPGFNMYNAYKLLTTDEQEVENELLKRGTIYKPEEKPKSSDVQPVVSASEQKEEQTVSTAKVKSYKDMTIEEKREFLLRQRERIVSDLTATDEEINTLGRQR